MSMSAYSATQRRNDKLAFRASVNTLVSLLVKLEEYRRGSNYLKRDEVDSLEEEIYTHARHMARVLSRINSPDGEESSSEIIEDETNKILTNASRAAHAILSNRAERSALEEVQYRDIEGASDEDSSSEDEEVSRRAPLPRLAKRVFTPRTMTRGPSKGMQQSRDSQTGRFRNKRILRTRY